MTIVTQVQTIEDVRRAHGQRSDQQLYARRAQVLQRQAAIVQAHDDGDETHAEGHQQHHPERLVYQLGNLGQLVVDGADDPQRGQLRAQHVGQFYVRDLLVLGAVLLLQFHQVLVQRDEPTLQQVVEAGHELDYAHVYEQREVERDVEGDQLVIHGVRVHDHLHDGARDDQQEVGAQAEGGGSVQLLVVDEDAELVELPVETCHAREYGDELVLVESADGPRYAYLHARRGHLHYVRGGEQQRGQLQDGSLYKRIHRQCHVQQYQDRV